MTGERWQRRLTELDHQVEILPVVEGRESDLEIRSGVDLVIALHARRSAHAVECSVAGNTSRPTIVALTGTDLYDDLPDNTNALRSVESATRLVVLQDHGLQQLASISPALAAKASVVHQSVEPTGLVRTPNPEHFTVVVLAHLRAVKDPLLSAKAAQLMADTSQLRVLHAGSAHSQHWRELAETETRDNPRYQWLGGVEQLEARRLLANADVLACTSKLEGGANVVSEAIALGVGVVGTNIGGNRGLLGDDHPTLVKTGDHEALARVFTRLESEPAEREALAQRSRQRKWMTDPSHERSQWQTLLDEL